MGLYFLIACQGSYPVIPCLQDIAFCNSPTCCHNYPDVVDQWEVHYHDCIQIVNNNYAVNIENSYNGIVVYWQARNHNDVGQLLKDFFNRYADWYNLTDPMTIRNAHGVIVDGVRENTITIQDPFIRDRNVA